jgi:hypothetical protein
MVPVHKTANQRTRTVRAYLWGLWCQVYNRRKFPPASFSDGSIERGEGTVDFMALVRLSYAVVSVFEQAPWSASSAQSFCLSSHQPGNAEGPSLTGPGR